MSSLFNVTALADRWTFTTPAGDPFFYKAVSMVDTKQFGSNGDFVPYSAVYLQSGGALSADLALPATDSYPRDVVNAHGVTVQAQGDAIFFGMPQPPLTTYIWLDTLGVGGHIEWSYSTGGPSCAWALVNENGQPSRGTVLGPNGSFGFDRGGDYGPDDTTGRDVAGNSHANRVTWWESSAVPSDFQPCDVTGATRELYYLRGVVNSSFSTAPVLNQLYDRPAFEDSLLRKYDNFTAWAAAMSDRLRSWGFNAAGQYSYAMWDNAPSLPASQRLVTMRSWQLSGWAQRNKSRPTKVVYDGAVCPPGSTTLTWQGTQADMWDPAFAASLVDSVRENRAALNDSTMAFLVVDEADDLYGMDSLAHEHMGYVAASQNPYHPRSHDGTYAYVDPRLFAKFALRDFLRDRHRAIGDTTPKFDVSKPVPQYAYAPSPSGTELTALQQLNAAWRTNYTTWDTETGNITAGTAAWGTGSGFMDENGRLLNNGSCEISYSLNHFNNSTRVDLDAFVAASAQRYGFSLQQAFALGGVAPNQRPPLAAMIYDGPTFVYAALGRFVDMFVTNAVPSHLLDIYAAAGKPIVDTDYTTATPDSALWGAGTITRLNFTGAHTQVVAPGMRFRWRKRRFVTWPETKGTFEDDDPGFGRCTIDCSCGYLQHQQPVQRVQWDTIVFSGDYVNSSYGHCLRVGDHVQVSAGAGHPPLYNITTQGGRARWMVEQFKAKRALVGQDGRRFVIGLEHWALHDPSPSNWRIDREVEPRPTRPLLLHTRIWTSPLFDFCLLSVDDENFGLATSRDNAYNGVEAMRAWGADPEGRPIGGEASDYGDVLTTLSAYLRSITR